MRSEWLINHTLAACSQLARENALKLSTVRHFVLDECDKMLEKLGE